MKSDKSGYSIKNKIKLLNFLKIIYDTFQHVSIISGHNNMS